jgi:agmatine deiminase
MITDNQTDFLYLADTLPQKYSAFYPKFAKLLRDCNVEFELLEHTKDVWAVDYMPIQVEQNKFVQFNYNPSYLQSKKGQKTISDVDLLCKQIGIQPKKNDIVLDGGNISRTTNKIIMTDRVFIDNPSIDRKRLINDLYDLLQIDKLYFIPEQPHDFTGHADGMVRFLDEHTVIINDFKKESPNFYRAFEIALHNTGLDCIRIPYNLDGNKNNTQANGDYINYLQMKDIVIVPSFNLDEDDIVIRQFEKIFSGQRIVSIDSNDIANDGGVLNCITWNIKK